MSASLKNILADLPPSSKVAGIIRFAADSPISLPTSVEPVNANLSIPSLCCRYSPLFEPLPVIIFITPFGTISWISFINSNTLSDVVLDGLNTLVSPAASTGASFQAAIKNGKFQGTIWPTTPIGSLKIKFNVFSSILLATPSSARITPAKYLKWSAAKGISAPVVSLIGFPLSIVSIVAKYSALLSIMSAILFNIIALSAGVVLPQVSKAFLAALTASSTSFSVASAISDSNSPFAGLYVFIVVPSEESFHSPPIYNWYFSWILIFIYSPP